MIFSEKGYLPGSAVVSFVCHVGRVVCEIGVLLADLHKTIFVMIFWKSYDDIRAAGIRTVSEVVSPTKSGTDPPSVLSYL